MGEDGDDPWFWGPQRLAQELCSTEQPWYPRDKPERFVSFELLSKNLEKHDVDGELLLSGTGQPLRDLLRDLGADSHQKSNRLHTAIKFLKGRSVAFQKWEASASRPFPSSGPGLLPESTASIPAKPAAAEPVSKSVSESVFNPAAQELKHQAAKRRFEDTSLSDGEDCVFLALPESEKPSKKKKKDKEKKKKKKRLAPSQLTAVPAFLVPSRSAFAVPTEADIITRPLEPMKPNDGLMTLSTGAVVGFLGITKSPWTEALEPGFSESDSDDNSKRTFQVLETERAPGRSLHVNRGMRALLLRQYSRIGHLLTNKFDTAPEPDSFLANQLRRAYSKGYGSSDLADEELFGSLEDDDDEQFDPQTLREIEEEEEEMARMKQQAAALNLSKDVVNRILDEVVADTIEAWQERKLPRLQTKAYSLWMEARRVGSSIRLNAAHDKLRGLEVRLAKLRETILDYTWTSERRVRQQGACLEQTIEDKQEVAFRIKLFSSGEPPQKPNLIRPSKPIRPRRERSASLDPLEEELTSDDDEPVLAGVPWTTRRNGMRERDVKDATTRLQISTAKIVIGDEHRLAASPSHTPMDLDTDSDEDEVVNNLRPALVKKEVPQKKMEENPPPTVIDLTLDSAESVPTSPSALNTRSDSAVSEKSDSKLDDTIKARNKATSLSDEFWLQVRTLMMVSVMDKYLIERIWSLNPETQGKVLEVSQEDGANLDSFWEKYILRGLKPDTKLKTLSALITRLFISWYELGSFRIAELTAARQHPENVEAQRHRLGAFVKIIVQVVPRFPKIMAVDELGGRIQVAMDAQAIRVRQMEQERRDKIEARRHELRRKLASDVPIVGDRSRLIINESKEEGDGFIHIGGVPASHIKDHQVEGVRFLWNQIVVPPEQRHGCLLAHTMGLGKTMQVISLLLAILDAANSSDPSVRSQIPEDLRVSRTVVVCPSSLALNWRDEILLWDSEKTLGDIYILGGTTMSHMDTRMLRESTVEKWSFGGGVLIIGYTLLARLFTAQPSLIGLVHQSAAIVVADEAHNIKTLTTQMRKACVPFKTRARIALTGSPLANNVREYFSMIDWVAPNYLGGYKEFEVQYTTVIQKGLWRNSSPEEKWAARAALKKLSTEIAPKVHRMDMSVLRGELPEKKEFVMFIPPTDLQRLLYDAFTSMLDTQRDTWGAISYLALICAHPQCFIDKAKAVLNGTDGNSEPGSENEEAEGPSRVIRDRNSDLRERKPVMTRAIAQAMVDLAEDDLSSIDHSWRFKHLMVILEEARAAGEKTIIFSRRIRALTLLEMYLRQRGRRWSRLDGTTPMKDRLPMIKDFNSKKEVDLFLISTKAGGVGLNIYGANRVVILDYEHNPVWEQQAIGRAYRIGQTKPVFVYWFVMWGAHEWKIHNRSVFKNQLAHRVVDNRHNIQSWSQDESAAWIRPLWDLDGEVEIRIRTEYGHESTVSVRLTLPKSEAKAIAGKDRIMDRLLGDQETSSQILTVITSDVFEEEDPLSEAPVRRNGENDKGVVESGGRPLARRHTVQTTTPTAPVMQAGYTWVVEHENATLVPNAESPSAPGAYPFSRSWIDMEFCSRWPRAGFPQEMLAMYPRLQANIQGLLFLGQPVPSPNPPSSEGMLFFREPILCTPPAYVLRRVPMTSPILLPLVRWSVWFYYLVPIFKDYMRKVPWESFAPVTESLMSAAPGTMAYWLSEAITVENLPRAYGRLTWAVLRLCDRPVLTAFLRALIEPHLFFDATDQFLEAAIDSAINSPLSPLAPMDNLIRPYPVLPAPQVNAERQPAQVGPAPSQRPLAPPHQPEVHPAPAAKLRDPNHLSEFLTHRNRDHLRDGALPRYRTPKQKEDEIALREIADRRKRRSQPPLQQHPSQQQPRPQERYARQYEKSPLPRWASEAIRHNGDTPRNRVSSAPTPTYTPSRLPARTSP